jgi:hypothetical protein
MNAHAQVLVDLLTEPKRVVRAIRKRWPGTFEQRLAWDALDRPHYAYGTYHAALQAHALGLSSLSVLEMGVAGGNGLVTLERIAETVEEVTGVTIAVYGFDAAVGMPPPVDYRDLPYVWHQGLFEMDRDALLRRLRRAHVIIGDVAETVGRFVASDTFPPIGFVASDLDYYSSTVAALALLDAPGASRLPRVYCYFDDVIGDDRELHHRYAGELLAIDEFNDAHPTKKVAPIHGLAHKRRFPAAWNDQLYVCHDFAHPLYGKHIHPADWDLRLPQPEDCRSWHG